MNIVDKPKVDSSTSYSTSQDKKKYTSGVAAKSKGYGGTIASAYTRTYTSYSGNDMVCIFELPMINGKNITKVVGEMQTISYSLYNQKMPVRVLGDMNYKSYVFSNRMVAGKMIFTVFDRHWAQSMMNDYLNAISNKSHVLIDEIPPINVTISMTNEYGSSSRLALYGVTFVSEGQVMSVQDMYTENTFEFFAKDVDYLSNITNGNRAGINQPESIKEAPNTKDTPEDNTSVDKPVQKKKDENKKREQEKEKSESESKSSQETAPDGFSKPDSNSNPYIGDMWPKLADLEKSTRAEYGKKLLLKKRALDVQNNADRSKKKITEEEYMHRRDQITKAYNDASAKAREYYDKKEREKKK